MLSVFLFFKRLLYFIKINKFSKSPPSAKNAYVVATFCLILPTSYILFRILLKLKKYPYSNSVLSEVSTLTELLFKSSTANDFFFGIPMPTFGPFTAYTSATVRKCIMVTHQRRARRILIGCSVNYQALSWKPIGSYQMPGLHKGGSQCGRPIRTQYFAKWEKVS